MKIEFLEFFPTKINYRTMNEIWSFSVRIPRKKITIKGIGAIKTKTGNWVFRMPKRLVRDHKSGKKVLYTIAILEDSSEREKLLCFMREKFPLWLAKKLKENPVEWKEWQIEGRKYNE